MADGIFAALSGAMSTAERVELISHNIANSSTPAFRQSRMTTKSAPGPTQSDELVFALPTDPFIDTSAGQIRATDNPMDIALTENVFMEVDAGGQKAYQRGATFTINAEGRLVTNEGYIVLDADSRRPIELTADIKSVNVNVDGSVVADGSTVGQLRLVEFKDQQALTPGPGRCVLDPGTAGIIDSTTATPVLAGFRESANFNVIRQMSDMIAAHRTYDISIKAIKSHQQINTRVARGLMAGI